MKLGIHLWSGMNLGASDLCIHVPYSIRKGNLPSLWTSPQGLLGVLGSWQDFRGAQLLGVAVFWGSVWLLHLWWAWALCVCCILSLIARKGLWEPWRAAEVDNSKGNLDTTGLEYPLITLKGWKIEGLGGGRFSPLWLDWERVLTNDHPNNLTGLLSLSLGWWCCIKGGVNENKAKSLVPSHAFQIKSLFVANRKAGSYVPPATGVWNESPCVFLAFLVIMSPFEMKASVH